MRAGVARMDSGPGDGASPSVYLNSIEKPVQKGCLTHIESIICIRVNGVKRQLGPKAGVQEEQAPSACLGR
jgi:hypothetical protein